MSNSRGPVDTTVATYGALCYNVVAADCKTSREQVQQLVRQIAKHLANESV